MLIYTRHAKNNSQRGLFSRGEIGFTKQTRMLVITTEPLFFLEGRSLRNKMNIQGLSALSLKRGVGETNLIPSIFRDAFEREKPVVQLRPSV